MLKTLGEGPFETFGEINDQFETLKKIWIARTVAIVVGFMYLAAVTCKGID